MKLRIRPVALSCLLCTTVAPVVLFLLLSASVLAESRPVEADHGMVATAHPLASQVGIDVLKKGGNAVDAAVATALALTVVEPHASGLGGGGFMLIYLADRKQLVAIDHRETAPSGIASFEFATLGHRSVAVPGTLAGLAHALKKYGTMSLAEIIEPAARLADEGFPVDSTLSKAMKVYTELLSRSRETRSVFLHDGRAYTVGELLRQRNLARTLRLIGREGADVFYKGRIAEALAEEMKEAGGWMTTKDIESYLPIEGQPVSGTYRGYEVVSVPPPGSGLLIIEFLNIIEGWDLKRSGPDKAETIRLIVEALRRVFVDRQRFLGDPSFVHIPVESLLTKQYAEKVRKGIAAEGASPRIKRTDPRGVESDRTTHVCVVDRKGNAVSHTQTLGNFFGSGVAIPGTGILLNNQMSDFSVDKKSPNSPKPGKRPASSISPTMVLKDGKPRIIVGGAGAMRIVSSVSQILINMIDRGMDVYQAISAPRVHAQSLTVSLESRIPPETRKELAGMGYRVDVRRPYDLFLGGAQAISIDPKSGKLQGAADPRRGGVVAGY